MINNTKNLAKEVFMNLYTKQHKYYCRINLHAKTMYLCIINQQGGIVMAIRTATPGMRGALYVD